MLFRRSHDNERFVWIDRGIDRRVDEFRICESCDDRLSIRDAIREDWHEVSDLCLECRSDFAWQSLASDMLGLSRPLNGMSKDGPLSNMEMESEEFTRKPPMADYFRYHSKY